MSGTFRTAALGTLAAVLLIVVVAPAATLAGSKGAGEACYSGSECASGSCVGVNTSGPQGPESGTCSTYAGAPGNTPGGQGSLNLNILKGYKTNIEFVINGIFVPLLFAIAFLVFVWGVFKYFIWGADSPDERKTGRDLALYGIIGFVVILSVWGLVLLVMNTLGLWGGSAGSYRLAPPSL